MIIDPSMSSTPVSLESDPARIPELLSNIERSLATLLSAADTIVAAAVPRNAVPLLFERVDMNARRAEEAMRELREFSVARTDHGTELSQSLTVVVLVADMVVSGHLAPTSLGDEELFRRNAIRALACIEQLRNTEESA